jgi:hypothetical protein
LEREGSPCAADGAGAAALGREVERVERVWYARGCEGRGGDPGFIAAKASGADRGRWLERVGPRGCARSCVRKVFWRAW